MRRALAACVLAVGVTACAVAPTTVVVQRAKQLTTALAQRSQETDPVRPSERPVGRLTIPALNLYQVPIYDRGRDAHGVMRVAGGLSVSRYTSSAPIGSTSNTVLYGHDDIEGSVFGSLASLHTGDQVYVSVTSGPTYLYVVAEGPYRIPASYTQILAPSRSPELTLFTCYPNFVDTERVFVVAVPPRR